MPRLVMARLFYAEGPQSAERKRVIVIRLIKNIFEFRRQSWALSPPRKKGMQETLEMLVFLDEKSDSGAGIAQDVIRTMREADVLYDPACRAASSAFMSSVKHCIKFLQSLL